MELAWSSALRVLCFVSLLAACCLAQADHLAWNKAAGLWGKRSVLSDSEEVYNFQKRPVQSWTKMNNLWGKRAAPSTWQTANGLWGKRSGPSNWQTANGLWGKRSSWQQLNGMWGKRSVSEDD